MDAQEQAKMQQTAAQLQQLQQYLQMLEEQTIEVAKALESMEELQKTPAGTEAYVPLTNGIYVKATLQETKQFLINAGNDIITAQTPQKAQELLRAQQQELQEAQAQLSERFSELYKDYLQQQIRLQEGA